MLNLEEIGKELRKKIIKMNYLSGAGHITSSCSCLEILITLYLGKILKYDINNPNWENRDFFLISKGHAAMGVYAVMSKAGFFPESDLWTFCQVGSKYGGHPSLRISGVESTSGSLGHGLSIAAGIALGCKIKGQNNRVFCLTGDGELQEGSNWEAAMFISQQKLNNLTWIIDRNNLQIAGSTEEIVGLEKLEKRLKAFGFLVKTINGHNYPELLESLRTKHKKPFAIIAKTIKGYGIPFLEGKKDWHGRKPNEEELKIIMKELKMEEKDLKNEKNI